MPKNSNIEILVYAARLAELIRADRGSPAVADAVAEVCAAARPSDPGEMSDAEFEALSRRVASRPPAPAPPPPFRDERPDRVCGICLGTVVSHPMDMNIFNNSGIPYLRIMCDGTYVRDGTVPSTVAGPAQ